MKSFFENKKVSENCYEKCLSLKQLFTLFAFIYAPWELKIFKIKLQISDENRDSKRFVARFLHQLSTTAFF